MEYAIAIFAGVWISAAGILAYHRIKKDFAEMGYSENRKADKEDGKR